ncbi:MAG: response regulator [Desulfobacterales bacterium]|nr:response regulator [Desulfobacterales bacterium]
MIKNSKILIADDEPRLCSSLKTLLSTRNYEVQTCNSGNESLKYLTNDKFELILLDIFMEDMTGFQVIEKIMNQAIDTSVIIMTGNASTDSAVRALRMGANDYLKKPFEPEELYTSVRTILNQRTLKKKRKENEQRYETLVNIIPQGIQITNPDGKIIFSNPAHHKIHDTPNGGLIGKYLWELIAEEADRAKTKEYYKSLIRKQPNPEIYFTVDKTIKGKLIYTQINWDYIRNSKGELTGIISVISDITKRKKAEKGREKILKALQQSLENVKTLNGLLPICSHCKKIRDDKGDWNQLEKYIQQHSYAKFSHGICPECSDKLYNKENWYLEMKKKKEQKE